jgi:hypothetical protein
MSTENLSDTSTWLPLDGLEPGFDENRAELTDDLTGLEIVTANSTGFKITHRFKAETVHWSYPAKDGTTHHRDSSYEAFLVDDGLYYVQIQPDNGGMQSASLFLDTRDGVGLAVIAEIGSPTPGKTRVSQRFIPFTIAGEARLADPPAPSTELIGRRVYWRYSKVHAYEHVYLSPQWYTWHCLAGPEKGLADTDEQTTYKLREGIYVFMWREKVIPCASVTVADHRDHSALRSHGVLFGLNEDESDTIHFTFGAHGAVLSQSVYPPDLDPRN